MSYLPAPGDTVRTLEFEYQDARGVHTRACVGIVKESRSSKTGITIIFDDTRRADLDLSNPFDSVRQLTSEEYTAACDLMAWSIKLAEETPSSIRNSRAVRDAVAAFRKASGMLDTTG